MPICSITSVKEEPETKLHDWRVYEVQQADRKDRTRHLIGSVRLFAHKYRKALREMRRPRQAPAMQKHNRGEI